jgi:hypothetical protein
VDGPTIAPVTGSAPDAAPRAEVATPTWLARARYLRNLFHLGRELPRFLGQPVAPPAAREWLRGGLAAREASFLHLVHRTVYRNPRSPYLPLLRVAGCEPGDFAQLVDKEGVDGALERLRDAGVYLTFDEFKGRRDVERSGQRFRFRERDFDPPKVLPAVTAQSGGTRGPSTRVRTSLPYLGDLARATALALDAHGLAAPAHAVWLVWTLPILLLCAKLGRPPASFHSLAPLSRGQRVAAAYVSALSRMTRCRIPGPRFLALDRPEEMARWLAATAREGRPVCLTTYASSAVRVARAAQARGLDLTGVWFITLGEPFTDAKRATITAAGAKPLVRYALTEAGILGFACATPRASDDLHFYRNAYALIERTRPVGPGGPTVEALLVTSLLPTAPKIMLNVETGDCARLARRECGCALGAAGLTTHLQSIRSFEKLSSEGMTFIQLDLLRVLEDVLPARFGGVGADYQVVEEEDPDGILRLSLIVAPEVGPVDPEAVRSAFLDALAHQPGVASGSVRVWRHAETVRVVRRSPVATTAGKILPFHVAPR